jgi:TonB family protein
MKPRHFVFIASVFLTLFGCVTQQPTKDTPVAIFKQEDLTGAGDVLPKAIRTVLPVCSLDPTIRVGRFVTVELVVDSNGKVVSPAVIDSPDPILSKAVLDAISQWEFLPGEKNGKKVDVQMKIPVSFVLDN